MRWLTIAVAGALVLGLCACGAVPNIPSPSDLGGLVSGSTGSSYTPTDLGTVEIRDYQGKKLSAIADEPENSIKGPQKVDISTYQLKVDGLVGTPIALSYDDVRAMPVVKKAVLLNCVEGWKVTYLWEGVLLKDLLAKAGGASPAAKVLIFHCVDGYTSSLPLDYITNRDIILGYKINGMTMPIERGYPFQVVAEDRFGYKWAKWVKEIEVSSDEKYLGYWEKRGYDNSAVLPGAK